MNRQEAIQIVKNNCPNDRHMLSEALEFLIPELKESEDERIRKAVKEAVEYYWSDDTQARTDIIVWLEKQDPKKHEEELEKAYKTADEVQYKKGYEDAKREFEKQGEQKPAWSEEDEKMWITISDLLWEGFKLSDKKVSWDKIRCWLLPKIKSLKERYTWKPSDEQIKALNYVINLMVSSESPTENNYYYNVFKDMRTQLKKLK